MAERPFFVYPAYLLAEMRRWPEAIADADWVLERITDTRFRLLRAEWLFRNNDGGRSIEECTAIITKAQGFVTCAHGLRYFSHAALGHDAQGYSRVNSATVGLLKLRLVETVWTSS